MRRVFVLSLFLAGLSASPAIAAEAGAEAITAARVEASVGHLASDELEGRGSGAEGGRKAGAWLAEQAAALGLQPGGDEGTFFHGFESGGRRMRNVVATLPGRDRSELVVIGAHYDHLGLGHQQGSLDFGRSKGRIHNGADDNASGTAAVLEIARAFVAADRVPQRTIVFAWFDGEERGLLGSKEFVRVPPVTGRAVLMINLDMVGRLGRRLDVYGAGTGDLIPGWLERANADLGLDLRLRQTITANSDHHPFYQKGVPVLVPFTGLHADYHRPSDDVEDVNIEGIVQIAQLAYGVASQAANAEETAAFAQVRDGTMESMLEQLGAMFRSGGEDLGDTIRNGLRDLFGGGRREKPRLGVNLGDDGLTVTRVIPDTVASRAGVRVGDRFEQVDGTPTPNLDALRREVRRARGSVTLQVVRDGETVALEAEFGGKRATPKPAPQPEPQPEPTERWF